MGWILLDSSPLQNSFMLPLEKGNCWLFGLIVFQVYRLSKMETGRKKIYGSFWMAQTPPQAQPQTIISSSILLRSFSEISTKSSMFWGISKKE